MQTQTSPLFQGWRLVGWLSLALCVIGFSILVWFQFELEGIRVLIRTTARTSLLLFCSAFSASALCRLWPTPFTRWLRTNRRYLGISFAVSHALHAAGIASFAIMDHELFSQTVKPLTLIFGGVGYLFIIAMTLTSFDRTAAWLGQHKWHLLHRTGSYYIWFIFLFSEIKRAIMLMPVYWIFVVLLILVFALRLRLFRPLYSVE